MINHYDRLIRALPEPPILTQLLALDLHPPGREEVGDVALGEQRPRP
jgi:hypothetical protein